MNVYAKHRLTDIEPTCRYQMGEGKQEGQDKVMGLRDTNY